MLSAYAGHGEDAEQAGGDVLGADVGAEVTGSAAGVKDRRDGIEKLGAGLGLDNVAGLDHRQQGVEHAVLGRQPVGEQVHPPAHRLRGRQLIEQLARPEGQALHLVLVDGIDERHAGRKVTVERGDTHAGLAGDGAHRRLLPGGGEGTRGRREQHVAVAGRIRTRGTGVSVGQNGSRSGYVTVVSRNRSIVRFLLPAETQMTEHDLAISTMRTVRFHEYGEPGDVLRLETAVVPAPGPGRIRVLVHACGLAPADWALCRGLFAGNLPRGIGIDVSGTVDALGDGVTDVAPGDVVFGTADWRGAPAAGAADRAIMDHWTPVPAGLDSRQAAALPMALETAYRSLAQLEPSAADTILIHGAGSTVGFAAVQIALIGGARVIATAGQTYAQQLRDLGATVTAYGDGMVERVAAISGGPVDLVLNTAPVGGALPALVQIAGGDPKRVLTISDFAAAKELGVRDNFSEDPAMGLRVDVFGEFAQLAADGKFTVPISGTFALGDWRSAMEISLSGQARGKLLLLP